MFYVIKKNYLSTLSREHQSPTGPFTLRFISAQNRTATVRPRGNQKNDLSNYDIAQMQAVEHTDTKREKRIESTIHLKTNRTYEVQLIVIH